MSRSESIDWVDRPSKVSTWQWERPNRSHQGFRSKWAVRNCAIVESDEFLIVVAGRWTSTVGKTLTVGNSFIWSVRPFWAKAFWRCCCTLSGVTSKKSATTHTIAAKTMMAINHKSRLTIRMKQNRAKEVIESTKRKIAQKIRGQCAGLKTFT